MKKWEILYEFCENFWKIMGKLCRNFEKFLINFRDIPIFGRKLRKFYPNFGKIFWSVVEWCVFIILALYCASDVSQLKIYSLSVKKNDDICEVTNGNIITFSFSRYLSILLLSYRILSISKNIAMCDYCHKNVS